MRKKLGALPQTVLLQFKKWNLTKTECEIGVMILRGLSLRDISQLRGTSETTTRQQALSVYKKASVEGRHQLSGFFFEQFLGPEEKINGFAASMPSGLDD